MPIQILKHACASAIYIGCVGLDFLGQVGKWIGDRALDVGRFAKGVWSKITGGFSSFVNWITGSAKQAASIAWGAAVRVGKFIGNACNPTANTVLAGAITAGTGLLVGGAVAIGAVATTAIAAAKLVIGRLPIVGTLVRFFINRASAIWNFNWNITDEQIAAQQKSALISLSSAAGEAAGVTLGALGCGFIPGVGLAAINPLLTARLIEVAGDDIKDEVVDALWNFARIGTRYVAQKLFFSAYKNVRRLIKKAASGATWLKDAFPWLNSAISNWGEVGSKPWSFAIAIEERIEAIKDEKLQAFTEEFIENAMDSCTESALAVSYAL